MYSRLGLSLGRSLAPPRQGSTSKPRPLSCAHWKLRRRGWRGAVIRSTRAKPVVQADPDGVGRDIDGLGLALGEGAGPGRVESAEIEIGIFDFGGPVGRIGPLDAAAGSPAKHGLVARHAESADAAAHRRRDARIDRRRLGIKQRAAALRVNENLAQWHAEPAGHRAIKVGPDSRSSVRSADGDPVGIDSRAFSLR